VTWLTRNRAFRIIAFPVLAITFLIGWIMYSVGSAQHETKPRVTHKPVAAKHQVDLEMGLLSEVEEEQRVAVKN
jgi:hypothetical protein